MKTEQFNQLQAICILNGLCYSLNYMIDELVDYGLPEEIAEETKNVWEALQSVRRTTIEYVIAHMYDYIDKEEDLE